MLEFSEKLQTRTTQLQIYCHIWRFSIKSTKEVPRETMSSLLDLKDCQSSGLQFSLVLIFFPESLVRLSFSFPQEFMFVTSLLTLIQFVISLHLNSTWLTCSFRHFYLILLFLLSFRGIFSNYCQSLTPRLMFEISLTRILSYWANSDFYELGKLNIHKLLLM